MKQPGLYVIYAAAVRDALGVNARPGAVLVCDGRVVQAGDPASLPVELVEQSEIIDRRDDLLMPAMVNAHTHLELTDIGPQPYEPAQGFMGWVKSVRSQHSTGPAALQASAERGAAFALACGVQAVGDIASDTAVADVRRAAGLSGNTYVELFGLGPPFDQPALEKIQQTDDGLQPHAPYSAGRSIYQAATMSERPVCTHLAETPEESEFIDRCSGPILDYLRDLARWDDAFADQYSQNHTPVLWMRRYFDEIADEGGWLVAHCNYVSDLDIQVLEDGQVSVAYCPIASEYFGHKDHRYRDMLEAGINVCLGTDSIVCARPDDLQPLGLLSAMRRLYQRDGIDPNTLLAMATTHGAKALRLDSNVATLQAGAPARFACIPIDRNRPAAPLVQALEGQQPIEGLSCVDA